MTGLASRRALLGGFAALPALAVPAIAATNAEAKFLALAPRLIPLLVEHDRIWATVSPLYDAFDKVRDAFHNRFGFEAWRHAEKTPEWFAYKEARRPADELCAIIERMTERFNNEPFVTLPGLILRHRLAKTLSHLQDDVLGDLDRLVEAQGWA